MKKIAMIVVLSMMLSLTAACGSSDTSDTTTQPDSAETTTADEESDETTSETDDETAEETEGTFDPSLFQVKAVDEKTLEVALAAPTPYFLELTAFPTYSPVPIEIINSVGESWATDPATFISNGAYQVTEWVPSSHITMTKNESYWDAENVGPNTIEFKLIEDSVAELNAFQTGEILFSENPPPEEIPALQSQDFFSSEPQMGTYYMSMNHQEAPFDDPLVRKAFALAIDRTHIASQIGNDLYIPADAWIPDILAGATPGSSFRDDGTSWWDPSAAAYEANCEEARTALAEAGFPDGEGFPTVTYIYNETGIHPAVAESLQAMWKDVLGVTVDLEVQEWATFLETRKNGEYQLARDGWLNDYNDPMGMLDLFISGSGNNNSQYSNPDYDALISQAKAEGDLEARFALMHQAEDILREDYVFAPIMYYGDPFLVDPAVAEGGFWTSLLGYKYFMYVQGFEDLSVCIGPNPSTVDPALNSSVDGATMIIHSFEGLYRLDKNGTPVPGLAESVDISEDGLVYTFHLRDDLQFSDGTAITAQTFVDSWVRAINPETGSNYSYMFGVIAGYEDAVGGESDH